jgi:hypothetical protein
MKFVISGGYRGYREEVAEAREVTETFKQHRFGGTEVFKGF